MIINNFIRTKTLMIINPICKEFLLYYMSSFFYSKIFLGVFLVLGFWVFMNNIAYDTCVFQLSPLFYLPASFNKIIVRIGEIRQRIYDFIFLLLLDTPFLSFFARVWHKFLFSFRHYSLLFFDWVDKYINVNTLMLFLALFLSRLHVVGYLLFLCILFIRLDFAVLAMARFYKRYPKRLDSLYPKPSQRFMWSVAGKIAQEAASNPKVQAVGVAVAGALAWKVLDVYDTQTSKEIADADRAESRQQAEADRAESRQQAEAARVESRQQAEADRAESRRQAEAALTESRQQAEADRAESRRQAEAALAESRRQAEATLAEMQATRADENRRHAIEFASQGKSKE